MAKTNNYSYKVNDGRRHGAFNIYQAKTGAIMLLMANSYTPLTLKQVNDLNINVFNLIDFEYEDFKKFYNQKAVEEKSLIMADNNELLESTDPNALVIHSVVVNEAEDWAKPDWECTKHCDCTKKEDCEEFSEVSLCNCMSEGFHSTPEIGENKCRMCYKPIA